jgi:hypothetical protein
MPSTVSLTRSRALLLMFSGGYRLQTTTYYSSSASFHNICIFGWVTASCASTMVNERHGSRRINEHTGFLLVFSSSPSPLFFLWTQRGTDLSPSELTESMRSFIISTEMNHKYGIPATRVCQTLLFKTHNISSKM